MQTLQRETMTMTRTNGTLAMLAALALGAAVSAGTPGCSKRGQGEGKKGQTTAGDMASQAAGTAMEPRAEGRDAAGAAMGPPAMAAAAADAGVAAPAPLPKVTYRKGTWCKHGTMIKAETEALPADVGMGAGTGTPAPAALAGDRPAPKALGCGQLLDRGRAALTVEESKVDAYDSEFTVTVYGFGGQRVGGFSTGKWRSREDELLSVFLAPRHMLVSHDGFQSGAKHQIFDLERAKQETFETEGFPGAAPYKGLMVFKTSQGVYSLELETMKKTKLGDLPGLPLVDWKNLDWVEGRPYHVEFVGEDRDTKVKVTQTIDARRPFAASDLKPFPALLPPVTGAPPVQAVTAAGSASFMDRGGPERTGVFGPDASGGRKIAGRLRWTLQTGGAVTTAPCFAGNLALVGSGPDRVVAVDLLSGAKQWEQPLGGASTGAGAGASTGTGTSAAVACAAGKVFVGGPDGKLHGLDAATGGRLLAADLGSKARLLAAPLVEAGTIYAGSLDGTVVAVSLATGKVTWRAAVCGGAAPAGTGPGAGAAPSAGAVCQIHGSLLVRDGVLLVGTLAEDQKTGALVALDPATGSEKWRLAVPGGIRSALASQHLRVFFVTGDGRVVSVDPVNRALRWDGVKRSVTRYRALGIPVVMTHRLLVAAEGHLLDYESGYGEMGGWGYSAPGVRFSTPTLHQGFLWIGGSDGKLRLIGVASKETRRFFELGAAGVQVGPASVAPNGLLVVGASNGSLHAVE